MDIQNVTPVYNIDFQADIEVDGTAVTNRRLTASNNGDTTIVTIGAAERMKLYKCLVSVTSDMTGEIIIKLGSTQLGGIINPRMGGQYSIMNCFPDYELGAAGEDLIVTLGDAIITTINASYEIV